MGVLASLSYNCGQVYEARDIAGQLSCEVAGMRASMAVLATLSGGATSALRNLGCEWQRIPDP